MRCLAFALSGLLLVGARARAADSSPDDLARARALYREAAQHSERGEYQQAIPLLEEGYRLSHLPGFLFNLGLAHRLASHCAQAVANYRAFIAADPTAPERPEAEANLAALEPCPSPPVAAVAPATAAPATAAPARPQEPGLRAPQPAPPPAPGRTLRTAGVLALGSGLAAGGAALFFALRARDAADTVNARYHSQAGWDAEINDVETRGLSADRQAIVFGVVGAGLTLTGAALYWLGWRQEQNASSSVSLTPLPAGAQVTWAARF